MSDLDPRDPRLDEAYRQAPRDEPPGELDDRILAAARRAVSAQPQSLEARADAERRRSWTARWRVPLSIAATVVLAATLTLMVQEEARRPADDESARARMRATPAEGTTPPAAPPAESEAKRRDAAPAGPATAPAPKRAAPPPPAEEQRAPAADVAPSLQMRRQESLESAAPPVPTAPAAAPSQRTVPAPAMNAPEAAKPAPEPPPGGLSDSLRRERALGERPARSARDAAAGAVRAPEDWLQEIRRLKAEGRDAEAAAELAEFRRRHPDYVLPADLAR
jgi:hypothetical protein